MDAARQLRESPSAKPPDHTQLFDLFEKLSNSEDLSTTSTDDGYPGESSGVA
jgi:hypothetical protein